MLRGLNAAFLISNDGACAQIPSRHRTALTAKAAPDAARARFSASRWRGSMCLLKSRRVAATFVE